MKNYTVYNVVGTCVVRIEDFQKLQEENEKLKEEYDKLKDAYEKLLAGLSHK